MYDEKEDNEPYGSCYCFADACVHVLLFRGKDVKETTKTGIIGAMDEEVNSLKEALDEKRINTIAGIAQVCSLNGVPFLIIRAISDKADDSEEMSYVEFEQAAAEKCAALTRYMVTH